MQQRNIDYIHRKKYHFEILVKVIITGGTGFIGKHLINRLLDYGKYSIAIVSNTRNFDTGYFKDRKSTKSLPLRFYLADITKKDQISTIFQNEKADMCIHLAAKTSVIDSIKNPDETMNINVKGTENVLQSCYENKVSNFIFASSAAVYGDVKLLPISEDHPLRPLSPYGRSKVLGERLVANHIRSKKIQNAIIFRIFNVYGIGQTNETDVITQFAKQLSKGLPPIIHGDGKHTRDFIFVSDVTRAFLLSLQIFQKTQTTQYVREVSPLIFNLGTGIPTAVNTLAQKMIELFQLEIKPVYRVLDENDRVIRQSYANVRRIKQVLGFVPKKNIIEGLREITASVSSHP